MRFQSAVGWWYWATLGVLVVALGGTAFTALASAPLSSALITFVVAVVAIGLPVWLAFSTHYTVDADSLRIRSGPFRWTIPRADITEVTPSRSVLSSPALSLDRLAIRYGKRRTILVSPRDKEGFLRALA